VTEDSTRLWGARFRKSPDAALMRLSRSDASHFRLVPYDLAASRAHARELERAGLLDAAECAAVMAGLAAVAADVAAGRLAPAEQDEDVHSFLERSLSERLGALGGKLRAGRSRNDQAANDLKLYLRDEARRLGERILDLADAGGPASRYARPGLHPSAAGTADRLRASAPGACPDFRPRRRPPARLGQAPCPLAARRRGARGLGDRRPPGAFGGGTRV
jgi:hypothetical protein